MDGTASDPKKAAWEATLAAARDLRAAVKVHKNRDQVRRSTIRARAPLDPRHDRPKFRKGHRPSPYRGVSWNLRDQLWVARIKVGGRSVFLGVFLPDDAESAARAYNEAAIRHFGDRAILNFAELPPGFDPLRTGRPLALARYWARAPERERRVLDACRALDERGLPASVDLIARETGLPPATVLVYVNRFLRNRAKEQAPR